MPRNSLVNVTVGFLLGVRCPSRNPPGNGMLGRLCAPGFRCLPNNTETKFGNMTLLKTLSVGLTAFAVASTAMAQTFFEEASTIQGKNIDLGNAGRIYKWSALSTNGNVSGTTTHSSSPNNIAFADNVGVWGSTANLILTNSRIQGDAYIRRGAKPSLSGSAGWSGTNYQTSASDSILSAAASHAATLSTNISLLDGTSNYVSNFSLSGGSIVSTNASLTISATDSNPVVLKLTDFQMSGGSLTLHGTAASKFIINVSRNFGLGNALVDLGPNVNARNVVFNVTTAQSTGTVSLSGTSHLNGLLVASNRAVGLTGSSIVSGLIVGKSVALSGDAKAKKPKPPKPSP